MNSMLTCFLVTAALTAVTNARIGFEKDLSMDVAFPGPVVKIDPSIPEGHMRPMGWQRLTDGPVGEVDGAVSTIEFYNAFVSKDLPVVMRTALPQSAPVFENWKEDAYILKQHGNVNVSVRVKIGRSQGKVNTAAEVMTMKTFLSEYKYEEWYLSSLLPIDMMEEIPLPSCVRCGTISERLWSAQLWMSSGGTSSRVHSHDDHLLHCVLFGRRDFIMIESHHKRTFDFVPDYSGAIGGHSDINTEMVDMFRYPQIARVPWTWSTLLSGDCIFVPAGYVHQVRSYGRSISLTIEFSPLKFFDDTGCTLDDEEFAPLSVASFHWAFMDGLTRISDKNLNSDTVRNLLFCLMGKSDGFSFKQFEHFYTALSANSTKPPPPARQVFDMMAASKGDGHVTELQLLSLSVETLSGIGDVFNSMYKKQSGVPRRSPGDGRRPPVGNHDEF